MLGKTKVVMVAICTCLIVLGSVGCVVQPSPEVEASLQPLPGRPRRQISPLMHAEKTSPPSAVGAVTPTSMLLAQATPVTEDLSVSVRVAPQSQSGGQTESPRRAQASPLQDPGGTPAPGSRQAPLPPPAAGYPARLPPSPLMAPDLPEMTLDQLIQIALDNQPRLRSVQAALEDADARVGTEQAGYFPQFTTTLAYNRQTSNVSGGANPASGNITSRRVTDVLVNPQAFTARFSQNVVDSFRREWRLQAVRQDKNAAEFDQSTARQDVILNVQSAYDNYLLARRLVEVNAEAVRQNI
jgi:hypothetical protein